MTEDKPISVAEWLDQFMDLDAYIANGGNLLDLPISSLDTMPPDMVRSLVERMSRERLNHLARFREHQEGRAKGADATDKAIEPDARPSAATMGKDRH